MPWVVIGSNLRLIHFQHHTGTWLTLASEEGLPPEVSCRIDTGTDWIIRAQGSLQWLRTDFHLFFNEIKTHWCSMHLLIYSTHSYWVRPTMCPIPPASWLRIRVSESDCLDFLPSSTHTSCELLNTWPNPSIPQFPFLWNEASLCLILRVAVTLK